MLKARIWGDALNSPAVPERATLEPRRQICACGVPVLVAVIGVESVLAAIYEWEPLHACERCAFTRASHPYSHVSCPRCNDTGLVGVRRPKGPMLAIDVGWADEIHVRVIGPRTDRIGGEALYALHTCEYVAPLHRNPRTRRYMA